MSTLPRTTNEIPDGFFASLETLDPQHKKTAPTPATRTQGSKEKILLLAQGRWKEAGYPSQSEADAAYCRYLAEIHNGDRKRIDAEFRKSPLMREKWDVKHGPDTYGNLTISKALENFKAKEDPVQIEILTERLSTLKAKPINWLVKSYLPLGVLVTMFAAKGRGKTKICDWFTAVVNGLGFRVIRFNLEDPKLQVLKPALHLAGANLDLVERVQRHAQVTRGDKASKAKISFQQQECIDALYRLIEKFPDTKLVIVEPVNNYKGDAKAISEDDMRPIYDALADVAEKTGVCILAVNHTNKKKDVDPLEQSYGASSGVNVARVNFKLEVNPDDKAERWLMDAGSNLPIGPTKVFRIVEQPAFVMDGETIEGIAIAVFERDDNTINAQEATEMVETNKRGQSNRIAEFLTEYLNGRGKILSTAVIAAAKQENGTWTPDNIKQVFSRKKIGTSDSEGFGKNRKTYWSLDQNTSLPSVKSEETPF